MVLIFSLTAVLSAIAAVLYLECFANKRSLVYCFDNLNLLKSVFSRRNEQYIGFQVIGVIFFIIAGFVWMFGYLDGYSVLLTFEYITLAYSVGLIAIIDYRDRVIPNNLLLFLISMRLVFLGFAYFQMEISLYYMLYSPFLGLAIGGGSLMIAKIFSKNGIGAGDVKLFGVIGFYVGVFSIFSVMIHTFFLLALLASCLLLLKKMKKLDTLPLAPFVFIAILLFFPLSVLGW